VGDAAFDYIAVNPTRDLELPAVRSRRERIASPGEAAKLIAALPHPDRGIWATAMYAGVRRGELMALRRPDLDLATGVIRVERGWDDKEGEIELKSRTSQRRVPIPAVLRDYLVEHLMGVEGEGFVFGRTPSDPFRPGAVTVRADAAWKAAGLERITLHEARHTFASLMIAAGVNAKALCTYMGHSSIKVTFDKYGHLMPGNEDEAAALLDAFLERADTQARVAQVSA
jgi:integrase